MKRNLFAELSEGFDALAAERAGKITLKHHAIDIKPPPEVSAEELLGLRKKLNLSRAIFARYLHINCQSASNSFQATASKSFQLISRVSGFSCVV